MKTLILAMVIAAYSLARGDVVDPVQDLKINAHLASGAVIYRWELNIDGRSEIFLDSDDDFHREAKHFENIPSWYVYLSNASNSGYIRSRGVEVPELGPGVAPTAPQINIDKMYVGPISQLGKSGIVTIQRDDPRGAPSVAYIRAYKVEGDHLKETTLAQYDPTKGSNPIYDQYLSKDKRTSVKLDKIIVN